ncbi:MAG: hypothetical protein H7841_16450 [Magnetospirillum sp. WYHS-4]
MVILRGPTSLATVAAEVHLADDACHVRMNLGNDSDHDIDLGTLRMEITDRSYAKTVIEFPADRDSATGGGEADKSGRQGRVIHGLE